MIRTLDGVRDVAVVGIRRAGNTSEMVVAVVEPEEGAAIDEDAIRTACRAQLAAYKVPRLVVTLEGELPRSMLGKVLRKQVRESLPEDL